MFSKLPGPNTLYHGVLAEDGAGMLWFSAGASGLFYQEHQRWVPSGLPAEFAQRSPMVAYTDATGRVWFGYTDNAILVSNGTRINAFTANYGVQVGTVTAVQEREGQLWIGGTHGLEVLEGNRFRSVLPADTEAFSGVSGIVAPSDDSLWLSEYRGAIHIPAGEISKALNQSAYRIHYELFDTRDGLPGAIQQTPAYPTAIQGTDGRIWFAASDGVAWMDPGHLSKNSLPPPVSIRSVVANGQRFVPPC